MSQHIEELRVKKLANPGEVAVCNSRTGECKVLTADELDQCVFTAKKRGIGVRVVEDPTLYQTLS